MNKNPLTKKQRKASRFYNAIVRPRWKQGQRTNDLVRQRLKDFG